VAEAFRPWLERCNQKPTAEQILALKVCDPAMGSGAFLVAVCRFLASWLVKAWDNGDGHKAPTDSSLDKDLYARRLIAQGCLYGVDKNPFAVNLAKLSLWLVTLSQDLPFTFVDHALKCGDSLVGYSLEEITIATQAVQLLLLRDQQGTYVKACAAMRSSFSDDTLNDEDYNRKRVLLNQQLEASEGLRQAGDLMVAAFFDAPKAKDRTEKQQVYLAMLSGAFEDEALQDSIQDIRSRLASGEKGITPFHWDLEFPEVFGFAKEGFDVVVGNPPYIGGSLIKGAVGDKYLAYLLDSYNNSHGKADLCSYFIQKCSNISERANGSYSLVVTSSVTEGRTREAGLASVIAKGDAIYFVRRKFRWPGLASVYASRFAATRRLGAQKIVKILNGKEVNSITSYFLSFGPSTSPHALIPNSGLAYSGVNPNGKGFILSADELSDLSLNDLERACILPFLGSDEMNSTPHAGPIRFAIRLKQESERELISQCPSLHSHLRLTVWEARQKSSEERLRRLWWQFSRPATELYEQLKKGGLVLASGRHSEYTTFAFQASDTIFSDAVTVYTPASYTLLAMLQSRIHELWALLQGSSLGSTPRYIPEDCFETFPFPAAFDKHLQSTCLPSLEELGVCYNRHRSRLMTELSEGLTTTYNRFHDPAERSPEHMDLRSFHGEIDREVLSTYGWNDVPTACGFGIDFFDTEEDALLPDELQERIDGGELFFWDAGDALDFQGQLQAYGAITGRRKLPWRYRWPDAVRDDVLARLLALNAERHKEEVALGLHTKAGKQAAKASDKRKKKTASAPEFQLTSDPFQTGLNLF
jgi:hypothetical protein